MVSTDASPFGLRADALGAILSVLEGQRDISRAFVFGSRARGDYRNNSDIDLAIETSVPTLCFFDVLDLNSEGSSGIRERALSEGVCIYERPSANALKL